MKKIIFALTIISLTNLLSFAQAQTPEIDYAKPKEYEIGGVSVAGIK